jgi:hypothetical protein
VKFTYVLLVWGLFLMMGFTIGWFDMFCLLINLDSYFAIDRLGHFQFAHKVLTVLSLKSHYDM